MKLGKKYRIITGIIIAVVVLAWLLYCKASITAAFLFAFLFVATGFFEIDVTYHNNRRQMGLCIVLFLVADAAVLGLSQLIQNENVILLPARQICLGLICCFLPTLLVFTLTYKFHISFFLSAIPLLLLSTVNAFVYIFRGSELSPFDLLSIETAVNVASKYDYTIDAFERRRTF